MALLGQRNTLLILRDAPPGLYLDGGTHGEILLPGRYIPPGAKPGGGGLFGMFRRSKAEEKPDRSTVVVKRHGPSRSTRRS
jgi:hypothetical protein